MTAVNWIPYAFVRMLVFYGTGILLGIFLPSRVPVVFAGGVVLTALIVYICVVVKQHRRQQRREAATALGATALLLMLAMGYLQVVMHREDHREDHLLYVTAPIEATLLRVSGTVHHRPTGWSAMATVSAVRVGGQWQDCSGGVAVFMPLHHMSQPYQEGDVVLIQGAPARAHGPRNPGGFDYRQYLAQRQVYHQVFLARDKHRLVRHDPAPRWKVWAAQVRQAAQTTFATHLDSIHVPLATALVLGVTDDLDPELLNAYADTGTLHVLAVSGLHIGVIYMLIMVVLRPLRRVRYGAWITLVISVMLLWMYAAVTGFSPSVLRAVMMFTAVAIGRTAVLQGNIYNTLAAAAFILLLADPWMILSVGFQLSFAAVFGIVALQPTIQRWWVPDSWWGRELWKWSAVSIAAQVATFPLSVYYFHQFPVLFLIGNLVAIPLSSALLLLGMALLVFQRISIIAQAMGVITGWLMTLMNAGVTALGQLPFAAIHQITWSGWMCCWVAIAILGMICLWMRRDHRWMYVSFIAGGCAAGIYITDEYHARRQAAVLIYDVPGRRVVDWIEGQTHVLSSDTTLSEARLAKVVDPVHRVYRVSPLADAPVQRTLTGGQLVVWHGRSYLFIQDTTFIYPEHLAVDAVVISHEAVRRGDVLTNHIQAGIYILDSSNPLRYEKRLRRSWPDGASLYAVSREGAYIENLAL